MAINQAYPSLNDIEPSWADIATTFTVTGGELIDMADIAGIKWDDKVTVGERRGASGGRVMARTTGSVALTASAELYRSGHRRLVKGLMANAPTRGNQLLISLVSFDIMIQHTPPGEDEIYVVKLSGCRLLGRGFDLKEGDDADKVAIELNPMVIAEIIDGKEVVLL
jgi:hypothetical protein